MNPRAKLKNIFLPSLLIFLLFLSGCMQFGTVVRVKPDGSGYIEETILLKKEFLKQMQAMAENMAKQFGEASQNEKKDSTTTVQQPDFFNEAKLKEQAAEFGEGVTFVSSSKITSDDYEGVKAVYAFADINKIRIKQDSKEKMQPSPAESGTASKKNNNITFAFTKGKPSELIIKIPALQNPSKTDTATEEKAPAPSTGELGEEGKALAVNMFKGMKMSLYVDVDGTIDETNATYRKGTRLTLLEVDFGQMLEKPEQLLKITQSKPATAEEVKKLMQDFPGIKFELTNEVKVRFH